LPTTLYHAKDWRFFFRHRASAGFAFALASMAFSPLAFHHLRLSLVTHMNVYGRIVGIGWRELLNNSVKHF